MLSIAHMRALAADHVHARVLFLSQSRSGNTVWGTLDRRTEVFVCATCGHATTSLDTDSHQACTGARPVGAGATPAGVHP